MFRSDEVEDGPNSRFHVIRSAERKTFTYNPEGSLWLVVVSQAMSFRVDYADRLS